jgi:magnesium chelatase family protein
VVTTVQTVAFQGIEAVPVYVQAQIAPGLPAFVML